MASILEIVRGSSPVLKLVVKEPGGAAPMSLVGIPLAIIETDLPLASIPAIQATSEANIGKATISFGNTMPLRSNKAYSFKIQVGAPSVPGTFATKPIRVVVK